MRQPTPELKNLARRLLAHEAKKSPSPVKLAEALEVCCQRLQKGLDPLIGAGGFRALLDRAFYLTKKEHSWLEGVALEDYPSCELRALREQINGQEAAVISETFTVILANIIWLLVTFIGEDITLGLLAEAWPDIKVGATASISKEGQ